MNDTLRKWRLECSCPPHLKCPKLIVIPWLPLLSSKNTRDGWKRMDADHGEEEDVKNNLFISLPSQWMPRFEGMTLPGLIIKGLPQSFIAYLGEDGIVLPDDHDRKVWSDDDDHDDDNEDEKDEKIKEYNANTDNQCRIVPLEQRFPHFLEFLGKSIEYAITSASTTVVEYSVDAPFPRPLTTNRRSDQQTKSVLGKLSWSCPKDAGWISTDGSIECRGVADLLQLLKASDRIAASLRASFDHAIEPELLLRPWRHDWDPSMEFRCMAVRRIRDDESAPCSWFLAITQRDDTTCYEFIESLKERLVDLIVTAMHEQIIPRIDDSGAFVVDLYIDRAKVPLVLDFATITGESDHCPSPILFEWNQIWRQREYGINAYDSDGFSDYRFEKYNIASVFRWIHHEGQCRLGKIARQNRLPLDLLQTPFEDLEAFINNKLTDSLIE